MTDERSFPRVRSRRAKTILIALVVGISFAAATQVLLRGFSVASLTETLTIVVIYSLSLGGLFALLTPFFEQRISVARFPLDWIAFLAVYTLITGLGAIVASFILYAVGIVPDRLDWQRLLFVNRLVLGITLLFGIFSFLYNRTRNRLEAQNLKLQQDLEQESRQVRAQTQELERAREIQEALLPKELPGIRGFELSGTWLPARMVGGDYYDVLPFTDRAVGLCIADVVGKGIGAALLMSNLQAAVRAFASPAQSPAGLCERVNQVIASHVADGKFITFFYGLLEPPSRRLAYCCAGHNPPIVVRRDGSILRLDVGGLVLGVFSDTRYDEGEVVLSAGDSVLLFTDGVTEAMNSDDEEYGDRRLVSLLTAARGSDAPQLTRQVLSSVTEFSGSSFSDDVTVLALRAR
jgi:sigma-B regulation protein RsbU (phosphoserine phosphatase)